MLRHTPQRTRREIEDALLAFELTERRVEVARQLILLAVTVALAAVTVLCALHGAPWPVSAGTGGSSGLTAAFSALSRRHGAP